MSWYLSGNMRYLKKGRKTTYNLDTYSRNKAMGPDRVTEEGMKTRSYYETKRARRIIEGREPLKDMRTDLMILPKKEGPCAINEHRPIAIMSHRTKIVDHEYTRTWGEPLWCTIGKY